MKVLDRRPAGLGQGDRVQTLNQHSLGTSLDVEGITALAGEHGLRWQIDDDPVTLRVFLDPARYRVDLSLFLYQRQLAIANAVVGNVGAETRRHDRPNPILLQGPHGVLPG